MISLKTARKFVKQELGGKPVHYRITFYDDLADDLLFVLDYSFEDKRLSMGVLYDKDGG